jgi:invasion protein IalB
MRSTSFDLTLFRLRARSGRRAATLAMLAALFSGPAPGAAVQQKFNDWSVACAPVNEKGGGEVCQMSQVTIDKKTGKALAGMKILRVPGQAKPIIHVGVPLGVLLPPGLLLKIDDAKESMRIPFLMCGNGCLAVAELPNDAINGFKQGQKVKISFLDGARHQITHELSLSGFSAAFSEISKKH